MPLENASIEDLSRIPCTACGYDLRTHESSEVCPECGQPVWRSQQIRGVPAVNLTWARRYSLGVKLLRLGLVLAVVGSGTLLLAGFGFAFIPYAKQLLTVAVEIIAPIAIVLFVIGVFYVTACNPQLLITEHPWSLRRLLRALLICVVAREVVVAFLPDSALATGLPVSMVTALDYTRIAIVALSVSVLLALVFLYFARTADSLVSPRIAHCARRITWQIGLGCFAVLWAYPRLARTLGARPILGPMIDLAAPIIAFYGIWLLHIIFAFLGDWQSKLTCLIDAQERRQIVDDD